MFNVWILSLCFINGYLLGVTIIKLWHGEVNIKTTFSGILGASLFILLPMVLNKGLGI